MACMVFDRLAALSFSYNFCGVFPPFAAMLPTPLVALVPVAPEPSKQLGDCVHSSCGNSHTNNV
tara:strand:+ start:201 stop:392 length:192 start_codon:yes stop_codon:yes gene_type:complete